MKVIEKALMGCIEEPDKPGLVTKVNSHERWINSKKNGGKEWWRLAWEGAMTLGVGYMLYKITGGK